MIAKKQAFLEITIVDGNLVIDGHDFEGQGCHALAEEFEGLGDVEVTRRKPEFFKGGADQGVTTVRNR